MHRAVILAISLWISACSSPAAPTGRIGLHAQSILAPRQRHTEALSSRWLVGYWDHRPACPPGNAGTSLWQDGVYTMDGGYGRWSLSGNTLTVIMDQRPDLELMQVRLGDGGRKEIKKIGPDTIAIQSSDAPISLFYRCR